MMLAAAHERDQGVEMLREAKQQKGEGAGAPPSPDTRAFSGDAELTADGHQSPTTFTPAADSAGARFRRRAQLGRCRGAFERRDR